MINVIAAVARNGVIGRDNKLPWNIPEDLKHFKELTKGKAVLMGQTTYESILEHNRGKPLPNRTNIVVTFLKDYKVAPGVKVYNSLKDAFNAHGNVDIFIIGGASIYAQTINRADRLYITHIHKAYEGDTYFSEINSQIWHEAAREDHEGFSFVEYRKREN